MLSLYSLIRKIVFQTCETTSERSIKYLPYGKMAESTMELHVTKGTFVLLCRLYYYILDSINLRYTYAKDEAEYDIWPLLRGGCSFEENKSGP